MVKKIKSPQTLRDMVKPVFEERFREMLGEDYEKFIESIVLPQRKSFRINTHKVEDPNTTISKLKEKGLEIIPVPWSDFAFFVEFDKEKRSDLGNLFEHFLGEIYVQEATSMTPPEVLEIPETKDINSNFRVLDMCAAPGSKTTQLATKMGGKGVLVANELDYKRLGPLKINLERSGFSNIIISHKDGNKLEGEEIYDRILLDAPCSGSGVIRKSPGTLRAYNPKKLKAITTLQLQLLKRAFSLLKKGGIMTYSTCSLDPEENEFVIEKFLEEENECELMQANLKGIITSKPLASFQGRDISKEIQEKTIRIWPQDNDTNGFYLAKLKKN